MKHVEVSWAKSLVLQTKGNMFVKVKTTERKLRNHDFNLIDNFN